MRIIAEIMNFGEKCPYLKFFVPLHVIRKNKI